ncbi:hydroxyacylglutathione hydrolase [Deefgea tanakiae]|uniref:Hydroxyacylglutathione hydrolase n=1 Tax=Deefgea tanakiae TaxID=2865840 RepID=A0ABX8ZA48_9NEIS|nr:hydroxyacylglutathione hydrolase [Deefgea tanakiae]QZA78030.1 hydroxyacylglutathione hydrolase [Deefgea tanakiae]
MLKISCLPIFTDNYIWLLQNDQQVVAVDPGAAEPLQSWLAEHHFELAGVIITHHHHDHTDGLAELAHHDLPIYGPAGIKHVNHILSGGETIHLLGEAFQVIATPGHTLDHLSFYGAGALFCGDTLFAGGCGRLFEGTYEQLFHSLQRLATLPPETLVCCTHEYTLSNLRFALAVDPMHAATQNRQAIESEKRSRNEPTLPSTIALELATNPYLRVHDIAFIERVARHTPSIKTALDCFTALRQWKDSFR